MRKEREIRRQVTKPQYLRIGDVVQWHDGPRIVTGITARKEGIEVTASGEDFLGRKTMQESDSITAYLITTAERETLMQEAFLPTRPA